MITIVYYVAHVGPTSNGVACGTCGTCGTICHQYWASTTSLMHTFLFLFASASSNSVTYNETLVENSRHYQKTVKRHCSKENKNGKLVRIGSKHDILIRVIKGMHNGQGLSISARQDIMEPTLGAIIGFFSETASPIIGPMVSPIIYIILIGHMI